MRNTMPEPMIVTTKIPMKRPPRDNPGGCSDGLLAMGRSSDGPLNGSATDDLVAVVEDDGLSGRDGANR